MKNKYPVHKDYRTINIGVPMYAPLLPLFQRMTRFLYAKQSVPSTIKCQKTHAEKLRWIYTSYRTIQSSYR